MLSVDEALDAIVRELRPASPAERSVLEALGMILARPAVSDVDSPPFDKALMDGFAVRAADLAAGTGEFPIVDEITAGKWPERQLEAGEVARIMTGAPLPRGADAVVQVEHSELRGTSRVWLHTSPVVAGRSVLTRGASARTGEEVLPAGRLLRAQEVGAVAELTAGNVWVYPRPTVAVLATGDELVGVGTRPERAQIRNSNEAMLIGQLRTRGNTVRGLGIARDDRAILRAKIADGLESDLLLLSGGVSAGLLDLVPAVLAELGVREVFHRVRVKPGQPLWFGVYDRPDGTRAGVFGLPGNPVSSMVCCELFVQTAIRRWMGWGEPRPVPLPARLEVEFRHTGHRPTFHPAVLTLGPEGSRVRPVAWLGSADLRATVDANSMLHIPAGDSTHLAGSMLDVYAW